MGFWIVECANLDEALDWAKKTPLQGPVPRWKCGR